MKTKLLGSAALAVLLSTGAAFAQAADHEHAGGSMKENAAPQMHTPGAAASPSTGEMQTHRSAAESDQGMKPDATKAPDAKSSDTNRDMKADNAGQQKPMNKQAEKKVDDDKATSSKSAADTKMDKSGKSMDNDKSADSNRPDRANKTDNRAEQTKPQNDQNAQRSDSDAEKTGRSAAKDVKLDSQQQTKVRDAFRNEHAENITKVDFDVRIGGVVPDHYHFYPLPTEVVDIVPKYRGYDYIMANDEIIIVEPGTHNIVYTMQQGRSSSRSVECR